MLRLLAVVLALVQVTVAVPAAPSAPACGSCCEPALMRGDSDAPPPCCNVGPERPQERATLSTGRVPVDQPSSLVGAVVTATPWLHIFAPPGPSNARVRQRRLSVIRI